MWYAIFIVHSLKGNGRGEIAVNLVAWSVCMCVTDTERNAVCSPQRPLKRKKAAITVANLLVEGVSSERERKNEEGKSSLYNLPGKHMRRIRVNLSSFFNLGVRWRWVVNATSRPLHPRAWLNTHFTEGLVISRAGLYCTENLVPHWESIPRTVQPVASRYTDYVTPAHETKKNNTAAEDTASVAGKLSLYAKLMTESWNTLLSANLLSYWWSRSFLWAVALCGWVISSRCFEGKYRLKLQG